MGCWNHTCAITNLPVMYNDPVYVILLLKQEDDDSLCYPTAFWRPLPFYFEGKYNDYGAVEKCHGPMLDDIIQAFKNCLHEMEVGENEYHDIPVKRDNFTIETLFNADHENRLNIDYKFSTPSQVKHIVIRKNVFEKLISQFPLEYYDDELNKRVSQTYDERLELVISELLKKLKKYDEQFLASLPQNITIEEMSILGTGGYKQMSAESIVDKVVSKYLDSDLIRYTPMFGVKKLLVDLYYKGDIDKIKLVMEQLTKLSILSFFMSCSRKVWSPQSGAGSQDSDTFSQVLLSNITIDEAAEFNKRFEE